MARLSGSDTDERLQETVTRTIASHSAWIFKKSLTTKMVDKWHDEEEAFLKDLEKQCNKYYDYYTKEYKYYNKLSSKFNIPILIISAFNALCAIALNDFLSQKFVSILNAILS